MVGTEAESQSMGWIAVNLGTNQSFREEISPREMSQDSYERRQLRVQFQSVDQPNLQIFRTRWVAVCKGICNMNLFLGGNDEALERERVTEEGKENRKKLVFSFVWDAWINLLESTIYL